MTLLYQFLNTAKEQLEVLEGMYKKMTTMFQNTAKYFAFDAKKYSMEEYFTDLKAFVDSFNVSVIRCFLYLRCLFTYSHVFV